MLEGGYLKVPAVDAEDRRGQLDVVDAHHVHQLEDFLLLALAQVVEV